MFETSFTLNDLWFMLKGAGVTMALTFWAILGGTLMGVFFGVVRAHAPWWLNTGIGLILDVFRSVPLLIQFVLFNSFKGIIGLDWSAFTIGCLVLAIYASSYCSEIVRGGVLSGPFTTRRAARSLGLTWRQEMTSIVFPLAMRVSLPAWISLTLGVMKDTALVLWIGIMELLKSSQSIATRINEPLFVLFIAGLIYFSMSFPIARLGARLEKRWREE